jgi:hypothetical protein
MRNLFLCSVLVLAGCQNIVGPAQPRTVRVDDPRLPVPEQEFRGRSYLALPDQSYLAGPQNGIATRPDNFDPGRK